MILSWGPDLSVKGVFSVIDLELSPASIYALDRRFCKLASLILSKKVFSKYLDHCQETRRFM